MKKEMTLEIAEVIKAYAQEKGILLKGQEYQTYSMLKYPSQNFPEGKMFISNNMHGTLRNKNVIVVALNENTIGHFTPDNVLERPKDKQREYMFRARRNIYQNKTNLHSVSLTF